jgi:hypothetical protein
VGDWVVCISYGGMALLGQTSRERAGARNMGTEQKSHKER